MLPGEQPRKPQIPMGEEVQLLFAGGTCVLMVRRNVYRGNSLWRMSMRNREKRIISWLLMLCMILSNCITVFAETLPIRTDDAQTGKTTLWSASFEDTSGFQANKLDSKGADHIKPVSSKAFTGDITYMVDLNSVTGNADYNSTETKLKLFDKASSTKYLTNTGVPVNISWSLTGKEKKAVNQYSIVSANDVAARDPKSWVLYGQNEGDSDWTVLDQRSGITFAGRFEEQTFAVSSPKAFSSYKLSITANAGNGGMTQLADIILGTGNPADDQYQLNGMMVDISNGPSSTWNQAANAGWSGAKALKAAGSITEQDAYSYDVIYEDLSIPVSDNTYLKYNIFPAMSNGEAYDFQYTQMYMAVDIKFSDGTYLSDLHAKDQNGNGIDAVSQGDSKTLTTNQWNQIYGKIGDVAKGKTIKKILVVYHKPAHDMTGLKDFTAYFDDIEIYNKGEQVYTHLSNYTNILRGTNDSPGFSRGLTAPAVTMPHGFNFWVPATNTNDNKIYDYQDTSLRYITISHEPSYWVGDRGTWQFMVNTSVDAATAASFGLGSLTADYSHENETAHAHYYSVEFDKAQGAAKGSKLELTPTDHGAAVRFTFDSGVTNKNVIFDCIRAGGAVTFDNSGAVTTFQGYSDHTGNGSKRMYVYGTFDTKAQVTKTNNKAGIASFLKNVVEMKIATSYISYDQAKKNLELEIEAAETFDDIFVKAQTAWDQKLGVVNGVKGAAYEQLVTLYSNLYRLFAYPNTMSENTGTKAAPVWKYKSPYKDAGAEPVEGKIYINNGFWDTYRTAWAAYSLLTPTESAEMLNGLVQHYHDQGWVPRWIAPGGTNSMVGTSSDVIFADALVKGISFDYEGAYASALRNAAAVSSNLTNGGRKNLNTSIFLGYTPGTGEDFSWSMEGYINDYGISQMAKVLAEKETDAAKKEEYLAEYQYYLNRAKNYVKLFDNSGEAYGDQWFKGKAANGDWVTSNYTNDVFDPFYWGESYTETNAFNMAASVPQDGLGLAALYGGTEKLGLKLDTVFETNGIYNGYGAVNGVGGIHEQKEAREVKLGQYGHSNQPSHHLIYMYNYAAQPWKTQKYVRDVLDRCYVGGTFGQGYIGDEDNGEMSAWYIFSALGFYPLQMGSDEFAVGSPLFDEVTLQLEGGHALTIKANNNSKDNVYVQSMKLNGSPYTKSYIKYSDIIQGGTVEFNMGAAPNTSFGTGDGDLPGSITALGEEPRAYDDLMDASANKLQAATDTSLVLQDNFASGVTGAAALIDNNSGTEISLSEGDTVYYNLLKGKKAEMFTITSGKTDGAPAWVTLYGAEDNGQWTELAAYNNLAFEWSQYTRPFRINEALQKEYTHYKFVFGQGTVSEIELLNYDDGAFDREDLGRLIQSAKLIDQSNLIDTLKEILNTAIITANAVYALPDSSEEAYTNAFNALKKAIKKVTGTLTEAYSRIEAEAFSNGNVLIDKIGDIPNNIGGVKANYWASYDNVLFKGDTNYIEMYYAAQGSDGGGYVEIHLDDKESAPVGIIQTPVTASSGWSNYVKVTAALPKGITGVHDVYLVFRNDGTHAYVANVDWFRFDAISSITAIAGEHGLISSSGSSAAYGGNVTFDIDPDDGYVIEQLLVNGVDTGFRGYGSQKVLYPLKNITQNITANVTFQPINAGAVTPSAIQITALPHKLNYTVGEALDLSGLEVSATFEDGTTVLVYDYQIATENPTAREGTVPVVISYGNVSASFDITVSGAVSVTPSAIRITVLPNKLVYHVGEALDLTGMEVTADYSDGRSAVVSGYEVITQEPTSTPGTITVTIGYEGVTAAFEIRVASNNPSEPDITGLEITKYPDKLEYYTGEALDLTGMEVKAAYKDGTMAYIKDYEVVTQNPTSGQGLKPITISYKGFTAAFNIRVISTPSVPGNPSEPAAPSISVTGLVITKQPNKLEYYVGEAIDLSGLEVMAAYSNGTTRSITDYQVSEKTAVKAGDAVITISYEGARASFTIHVKNLKLTLNITQKTMKAGESFQLIPDVYPAGSVYKAQFSSSDPAVASVNGDGNITANKAGMATITVSIGNGVTASCSVTVAAQVKAIKLKDTKKTLGVGEKFKLLYEFSSANNHSKVIFKSSKKSVAAVNAKGVITAKKTGTAIITVTLENGASVTCAITVKKAPASVKTGKSSLTLKVNGKYQTKVSLNKNSAGSVTYSSSDVSIVMVDKNGKLKAKKPGRAVITVKTYNGKTAKIAVTVTGK